MSDQPISGREPGLGGQSELSGREPFIGGAGSLAGLIASFDALENAPPEALVGRLAGVIPQIAPYLDGGDVRLRWTAARMIGLVAASHPPTRGQTVPLLIKVLDEALLKNEWPVIEMALDRLGDTEDARAAQRLAEICDEPQLFRFGRRYRGALIKTGHLALSLLIERAGEDDLMSRRYILPALREIARARPETHPAFTAWLLPLATAGEEVSGYEINRLYREIAPVFLVEPLYAAATDMARDVKTRARLLRTLGCIPDRRVTALMLDLLPGDERMLRPVAARALIRNRFRKDIPRILALLESPDPDIRRYGVRIAGRRHLTAAQAAITRLLNDYKAPVRLEAVRAQRRLRDPQSVGHIIGMLKDRAAPVRLEAVRALLALAWQFDDQQVRIAVALRDTAQNDPEAKIGKEAQRSLSYLTARMG